MGQDCGDMILAVTETEHTAYAAKHKPREPNSQECTLQTLLVAGMLDVVQQNEKIPLPCQKLLIVVYFHNHMVCMMPS